MRLAVGSRVTFTGTYRDDGEPYDPRDPFAVVTDGGAERRLSIGSGLSRVSAGVFQAVAVVRGPLVTVRFSHGDGEDGFGEQSYAVDAPSVPIAQEPSDVDPVAALRARIQAEVDEDNERGEYARVQRASAARTREAFEKMRGR